MLVALALVVTMRPTVPTGGTDGWTRCENHIEGFTVAYPRSWYSWGPGAQSCSLFDEAPIQGSPVFLPDWDIVRGRHPTTALQVVPYDASFDYVVGQLTDQPGYEHVLTERSTRVGGRRALVVETRATGAGFYEKNARAYWYVIEAEGRGFMVSTVAQGLRAPRYAEFKKLVDRTVLSLVFERPTHSVHHRGFLAGVVLVLTMLIAVGVLVRRRSAGRRER
jgi:hypothetical protein